MIAIDFETYYDDDISVVTMGPYAYSRHPACEVYMISASDGTQHWAGHPRDFNWDAMFDQDIASHNAAFDRNIYEGLVEKGLAPRVAYRNWFCTADLSAMLYGRRSLKNAVQYLYGESLSKAVRGSAKGKGEADFIKKPDQWAEMVEYAKKDAIWCWKLWNDYGQYMPPVERELSEATRNSAKRGVHVNVPLLERYLEASYSALRQISLMLPWVSEGKKPTSALAIADYCHMCAIEEPPLKSEFLDDFNEWEAKYCEDYPWVKAVGLYRQVNKAFSTLKAIKCRLRDDDTVETSLKYFGGHTGRWSGDNKLNFQNLRKAPLGVGDEEIDVRALFVPAPGRKFIICDYSQIEPRVLSWLAGDWDFIDLVNQGYSVYEAHARTTMGWRGGNLKEEDPQLYTLAKIRVLQLGYQSGWKKLQSTAAKYDIQLSEEEARDTVVEFRKSNPKIVDLWERLDADFKKSMGKERYDIRLPSGRYMRYPEVQITNKRINYYDKEKKKKIKIVTQFTANLGDKGRVGLYGGMLAENTTQATARDIFAEGLLRVLRAGYHVPFHVHDELVIEAPLEEKPERLQAILAQTPKWIEGCPVTCGAVEAPHYLKD